MLDEILYSFDHPALSITKLGSAKVSKTVCCLIKGWIRLIRVVDNDEK